MEKWKLMGFDQATAMSGRSNITNYGHRNGHPIETMTSAASVGRRVFMWCE